ncbi:RT0821/Lpp0805 family surface protein [Pararhizobium haloflavum]|uniref:RT0821/Lpp0805 family surface protein n=1 Tax=Pararhizobium haloflavum TaxID=2037914 RepID=UPI0012FFD6CE|nr:RT0821/Lpp0805 family surface protein [Pararhizobium haloflavum]
MGSGIDETLAVDTMTTGAIPTARADPPLPAPAADEEAVARAVAEIDLEQTPNAPFPWANRSTGSTGVISALEETEETGVPCRAFTTTVHRYDGIALFDGATCRDDSGQWNLKAFRPVS